MQQTHARDLAGTITWAERIVSDPRVVYLDTETPALDGSAEIVDIAVVDARGQVLLDTLVKPLAPIPRDATNIHGITDAMVADARGWDQIAPQIQGILSRASGVVIYNADFDTRIIQQCNARYGLPGYRANWQCAMQQYAAYAGLTHQRYGGYRWHRLTDAAARFGYGEAIQHRALADTRLCRAVVFGMAGAGMSG